MLCTRSKLVALAVSVLSAFGSIPGRADEIPPTAYISTGDNQWALWLPMDSQVAIESAVDSLAKNFKVNRLWWRGGQDELWLENFVFRPESRTYYPYMDWIKFLIEKVGTNRVAVESARKHGMSIFWITGLFESACTGDAGGLVVYPYWTEDRLRVEHPEWIPVNRFGTARQQGTIEYAYPQVRDAMVRRLAEFTLRNGYDGVVFYTYVENFSYRYADEFGYSDPIVEEYKKRHGVDIRTQEFDREAWRKLRGEYVTQFMRELSTEFRKHGKEIIINLNPMDADAAMYWMAAGDEHVSTAGNMEIDWRTWVKEGLVDELNVYWPPNPDLARELAEVCKGTKTRVSLTRPSKGKVPEGVIPVIGAGDSVESGIGPYAAEDEPVESLDGSDIYARRRALHFIAKDKRSVLLEKVITLTKDPDLYTRRLALRALAAIGDHAAIPAVEQALFDPENSVRCQAIVILGELAGPDSIDTIFKSIPDGSWQYREATLKPLSQLAPANIDAIVRRLDDPNTFVRLAAIRTLQTVEGASFASARDTLMKSAAKDTDPFAREMALGSLARYKFDPEVIQLMTRALDDSDEVVQARAAVYLTWLLSTSKETPFTPTVGEKTATARLDMPVEFELADEHSTEGKQQREGLNRLLKCFEQYGEGCKRVDANWGWRSLGNAIRCFGDEGDARLENLMKQISDRQLADRAWRVLYYHQEVMKYCMVTEEQDREAHQHHPFLKFEANAAPVGR